MFNNHMYGTRAMNVVRLVVQNTGTYNEQWLRPYVSTGNGDAMHKVGERIGAARGRIDASAFSGISAEIIRPSAVPETPLMIANGWGTKRFRFMLQIAIETHIGQRSLLSISGYTEYSDQSYGGHLSPQLKFFINSITELAPVTHRIGGAMQTVHQVKAAAQLVSNNNFQSSLNISNPNVYNMAPGVVFGTMEADRHNLYSSENLGSFGDTRLHLTGQPELLNRNYNNSQQYCARMTNDWKTAMGVGDPMRTSGDTTMVEALGACSQALDQERDAASNPFLNWLRQRRRQSYGIFPQGADYFTLEDLQAFDPNYANVMFVAPEIGGMHNIGSSCDWSGSDTITQAATILAQSMPSYMSRFGVVTLALNSSNKYGMVREPITVFTAVNCFNQEIDNSATLEALKIALDKDLFNSICFSNQLAYELELMVDTFGETWITLQLGDDPTPYVYVAPTFADAMFAPQLTLSHANVLGLANDFNTLFDNAVDASLGGFNSPISGQFRI